jgi:hypothetical protein
MATIPHLRCRSMATLSSFLEAIDTDAPSSLANGLSTSASVPRSRTTSSECPRRLYLVVQQEAGLTGAQTSISFRLSDWHTRSVEQRAGSRCRFGELVQVLVVSLHRHRCYSGWYDTTLTIVRTRCSSNTTDQWLGKFKTILASSPIYIAGMVLLIATATKKQSLAC